MDFVDSLGPSFLAHRLRRLSDRLVDQVSASLLREGLTVPARSMSTLLLLERRGPLGPVDIARELRFSHPLMVRALKTLEALGLVEAVADDADQRRRRVRLTAEGMREAERIELMIAHITDEVSARAAAADVDLDALMDSINRLGREVARHPIGLDPISEEV